MQKKGKATTKTKKVFKKLKYPLDWAVTKILPPVYEQMNYTPQELRYKFTQYIERSDKNGEEVVISWFSVFAQIERHFLQQHKESQEFSSVIDRIYSIFENRYEQKASRWENVQYIMNNRFKKERESNSKLETTSNVNPEVKDILDKIIYRAKKDDK